MDGYQKAIQRGLTTAESSLDKLYREPTLDEARAEFGKKLDAVVRAYNHMSETTNPEVFAFRARMITEACRVLERASYSICHAAEKAASK